MTHNKFLQTFFLMSLVFIICPLVNANPATTRGLDLVKDAEKHDSPWGNYYALIVGINDYQEWPGLQTAVKDARDLKAILEKRYGFLENNVVLILDGQATRARIIKDLREMASALGDRDNLLIYFAGHGQVDDLTGEGYWIPVEGDPRDTVTWISHSTIKNILCSEKILAKNIAVVADSCYSGVLLRGGSGSPSIEERSYQKKLEVLASRRSRQVISSGGLEPVIDGGRDGNSLFAYYFLKALRENKRAAVDIENLFNTRVWKYVVEIGGQRPSVGRLRTPMDEDGQFVFVLAGPEVSENGPILSRDPLEKNPQAYRKNTGPTPVLVDDCEDGDNLNEFGGPWYSFDDRSHMRGSSELWPVPSGAFIMTPRGVHDSRYCACIKGRVSSRTEHGFAGLGCFLNKTKTSTSLLGYQGVLFSFRGTPGRYRFKVHGTSTPDYDDFGYDFQVRPEWNTIRIPFNKLSQEGWGKATHWRGEGDDGAGGTAISLNWQTLEAPQESIELCIDDISFY